VTTNKEFKLKCWDVTVAGYTTARIVAPSRGKALAQAWRNDCFSCLTFGNFLKIAEAWGALLIPEYFGEPIKVCGAVAYRVGTQGQYISFVRPNETVVLLSHPADVEGINNDL
jgi:hypothetical protein